MSIVLEGEAGIGKSTLWLAAVEYARAQGLMTYYLYDDPNCTRHVVSAGQGIVDDGRGHIVRNESGEAAQDVSVIIAPEAEAFRGELAAPSPYCGF